MSHPKLPAGGTTAWITGAGGLIGGHFVRSANQLVPGWTVHGLTRDDLELTDFAAVERRFQSERPGVVIHCAAMSRSPDCQADPARARLNNVKVTAHLAALAEHARFVFFSTDLVFDGAQGNYVETDRLNPLSVYGETKAEAEAIVLENPAHLVIRTSLNGGPSSTGDRGFDEQLIQAWRAGRTPGLFTDEFRSPMGAEFTARAVWELVLGGVTGVYHVAGAKRLSRHQIGEILVRRFPEFAPLLRSGSLSDYEGAPRPPDTSLNCAKAAAHLSFRLPAFGDDPADVRE